MHCGLGCAAASVVTRPASQPAIESPPRRAAASGASSVAGCRARTRSRPPHTPRASSWRPAAAIRTSGSSNAAGGSTRSPHVPAVWPMHAAWPTVHRALSAGHDGTVRRWDVGGRALPAHTHRPPRRSGDGRVESRRTSSVLMRQDRSLGCNKLDREIALHIRPVT